MFFRRTRADRANSVFVGAFGEDQHMHAVIDQSHGDKPDLSVGEAVILALKRRGPIEPFRRFQGHAVLDDIRRILGGIELDVDSIVYTH